MSVSLSNLGNIYLYEEDTCQEVSIVISTAIMSPLMQDLADYAVLVLDFSGILNYSD